MRTTTLLVLLCAVVLTAFAGDHLTLDQTRERTSILHAEIARHDALYFGKAAPEITDAQYDELKRELRSIEEEFPELASAAGLGDDRVAGFPSYRHRARMLGLNKCHTEAELKGFIAKVSRQLGREELVFLIEPKYDGLAISVTYEKGRLVRAVTRGNGSEGDDVTANLQALAALPRGLIGEYGRMPDVIEMRGEVYMTHAEFSRINREREAAGLEVFAHPRNLAVGTLKQELRTSQPERCLEVVFYGIGAVVPAGLAPPSQQALHGQIRAWGLPGVSEFHVVSTAPEAWARIQDLGRRRAQWPYPTDGAVVKLDDLRLQDELGATDEAPRGAIAYKFPPDRISTRVTGITLQIGRTGMLSPVAELEPMKIGGSTIRRATLHNRAEIARKDIRIGDFVFIERAGEIIPAITGVDLARRPAGTVAYVFPDDCPVCHSQLITGGATVRCPNYDCPAQVQRRLQHFISNGAVDIDGFGPALIESLTQQGTLSTPADLYVLTREQLVTVTSPKSADKILAAITASKHRELWRFIHGIGVPEVGPASSKAMARHFPSLSAWVNAGVEDYQNSGINEAASRAALVFFAREENRQNVEALERALQTVGSQGLF
jgi:DNA ligase (NAD+)